MKAVSPQSALPTDSVSPWKGQRTLLFLHPQVLWLRWAVINFACLENILLQWFLKETHGVLRGFILFAVISTDICLEQQIKTHQCLFSVHPGGVLRSLECRLLFPPQNSNVNSFCQQIKPDLLDVSRALISSILLASITQSEAVIIPCHSVLWAGSAKSRIKRVEAHVCHAGVNQELTPQELHLYWLTLKEISSGSSSQHQLGLAP